LDERVKIHNEKRKTHYNYFDEMKRIEAAIKYWRKEGIVEPLIKDFKKFVSEL